MKRILSLFVILLAIAPLQALGLQVSTSIQSYAQTWGPVTTTGPLGTARNNEVYGIMPSTYTVDWFNDGTAASACTLQVEGSSDGIHWSALTGVIDCTGAVGMFHITNKPVRFVRYNILSYTSGGLSTAVTFNYTRGQ